MPLNPAFISCAAGPVQAVQAHLQLQDWRAAGKENSTEVVYLGLHEDCWIVYIHAEHQHATTASCTCDLSGTAKGLQGTV